MDYATFMHDLFYACVLLLQWSAIKLGMTYEELNIWVFVVIHPIITMTFFIMWLRLKVKGCGTLEDTLNGIEGANPFKTLD